MACVEFSPTIFEWDALALPTISIFETSCCHSACTPQCQGGICDRATGSDCLCYLGFIGRTCAEECPNPNPNPNPESDPGPDSPGTTLACNFDPNLHLEPNCKPQAISLRPLCMSPTQSSPKHKLEECPGISGPGEIPQSICGGNGLGEPDEKNKRKSDFGCYWNKRFQATVCRFRRGFFGPACRGVCPTNLAGEVCNGHGSCHPLTGKCTCNGGFTGGECTIKCPGDANVNGVVVPCHGHGHCRRTGAIAVCNCQHSWIKASHCGQQCPMGVNGRICSRRGQCTYNLDQDKSKCHCNPGCRHPALLLALALPLVQH